MARRKRAEPPPLPSPLPWGLRRENVTVETFVPTGEQPRSLYGSNEPRDLIWRRKLVAWRRWQAAVETWGDEHGMDYWELRARRLWPQQPPPFARSNRL